MSSVVDAALFGDNFSAPNLQFPLAFGPFTVHGRLGVGGMGVVLDATTTSGERIALKILHAGLQGEHHEMMQARLDREARLLQRLNHPGIVRLHDVGEHAGVFYVAMERVTGVTLAQVKRRASLTPRALLGLAVQLCDSLAHMHDAGVIHRDIKPSNVLIDRSGRAVLADFGIAWMRGITGITKVGEILGSAGYVAPEYFKGRPPSALSDQYALGKLLFELASTKPVARVPEDVPIVVQFAMQTEIDWSRFPGENPWPAIEHACIRRMLHAKPERRFPNMRSCLEAFCEIDQQVVSPSDFAGEFETDDMHPSASRSEADANTRALGTFVHNLKLEPGSPWSASKTEGGVDDPHDLERLSAFRPHVLSSDEASPSLSASSRGASIPGALPLASSATSSPAPLSHSVVPGPRDASHRSLRSAARLLGHLTISLLAGAGAMHLALEAWPGVGRSVSALSASWMPTSSVGLKYVYEPGRARTQDRAEIVARTMHDASVELEAFNFAAAEQLFGRCVELTDDWHCHAYLAAILGLRRDRSAGVYSRKAQTGGPTK